MSKHGTVLTSRHAAARGTAASYSLGFALSVVLTLIPFYLVTESIISGTALVLALMGFAALQLIVQLQFFIHLGHETKPRWNMMIFLFMTLVLVIVVGGSLWIMDNLDYHGMSPEQTETYIKSEERIGY